MENKKHEKGKKDPKQEKPKGKYGRFINIDENDKLYYHIYFNDNKEEIKNKYKIKEENGMIKHEYYIHQEDKVTKIKIIIDYQVKSFKGLFCDSNCIESILFKKFYRNNKNRKNDNNFNYFRKSKK